MYKVASTFLICLVITITISCTYHNQEDYFSQQTIECDTTSVSYSNTVMPIFDQNCYACHNSSDQTAGIVLDNIEGVKNIAETGILINVLKHTQGYAAMPKSAPALDECSIAMIEAWINQGMNDN